MAWTSIDSVRFLADADSGETAARRRWASPWSLWLLPYAVHTVTVSPAPVVIWIGVRPGSLEGKDAFNAANEILLILKEFGYLGIDDVEVKFRESGPSTAAWPPPGLRSLRRHALRKNFQLLGTRAFGGLLESIDRHGIMIEIHEAEIARGRTGPPKQRVIGHIRRSPPVAFGVQPGEFTQDWTAIELDGPKFKEFKSDSIDLGTQMDRDIFTLKMYPRDDGHPSFKYPADHPSLLLPRDIIVHARVRYARPR
ncbi:hypothetical protein K488DRAFT_73112 [Vararia minispora EC-137]|uniref:Uncharacterized protein n=1 Tax=Vararia minispora EC-137 TaxID=1314806 RepID=A0ACB8QC78_9AGAM|nr:hypothetical protein K488DRAFT_73112 [Vararia minispora EC-137]